MDTPQSAKRLIESRLFGASKSQITSNTKLLDDILFGATTLIACDPSEFPLVDAHGTRTIKVEAINNIPALVIFFKEFEDHIILLDIEINRDEIPF